MDLIGASQQQLGCIPLNYYHVCDALADRHPRGAPVYHREGGEVFVKLPRTWYEQFMERYKHLVKSGEAKTTESRRAEWGTAKNLQRHFDQVAKALVDEGIGYVNPKYEPTAAGIEAGDESAGELAGTMQRMPIGSVLEVIVGS